MPCFPIIYSQHTSVTLRAIVVLALILLVSPVFTSTIACHVYVAPNGADTMACGSSRENACASIEWVLFLGVTDGICMLPGVHTRSVDIFISSQIVNIASIDGDVLVDCQGKSSGWSFTNSSVTISGIGFANCITSLHDGAALRVDGNFISISDCLFFNNTALAGGGGAVSINNIGVTSVVRCSFFHNSAETNGGALSAVNGNGALTVEHCTFVANNVSVTSGVGGGVHLYNINKEGNALVSMVNCTLSGNSGFSAGGVLINNTSPHQTGAASVTVIGCTLTGNTGGGAVIVNSGVAASVFVNGSTWSGNHIVTGGYGLVIDNRNPSKGTASVSVSNCIVNGEGVSVYNTMDSSNVVDGTAVVSMSGCVFQGAGAGSHISISNTNTGGGATLVSIANCSVSGYQSGRSGGGMSVYNQNTHAHFQASDTTVTIKNCTMTGNSGLNGGAIALNNEGNGYATTSILVIECTLRGNIAQAQDDKGGGGIIVFNNNKNIATGFGTLLVSVIISGCRLEENTASSQGGGIWVLNGNANSISTATVTISDCILRGNSAPNGGAMYITNTQVASAQSASVTVADCVVIRNNAKYGGGMYISANTGSGVAAASVILSNCVVAENSNMAVGSSGGGLYIVSSPSSTVMVAHCTLSNNTAGTGGAVYATGVGQVSIVSSTIDNNTALDYGGGMYLLDAGDAFVGAQTIVMNNGGAFGAGMFVSSGVVEVDGVIFRSNIATVIGGALVADGSVAILSNGYFESCKGLSGGGAIAAYFADVSMSNCTFSGNSGSVGGALLISSSSYFSSAFSEFVNNSAAEQGGAADVSGAAVMTGCMFYNNSAPYGGALNMDANINSYEEEGAQLSCTECEFAGNIAHGGASIFWTGERLPPLCAGCVFHSSNEAAYGASVATPPLTFVATPVDSSPSNNSSFQIAVQLRDWYNQTVVLSPVPSVTAITAGAQVQGAGLIPTGETVISVTVSGLATSVTLQLQTYTLQSNHFNVFLGICAVGYGYTGLCSLCAPGSYTWNTTLPCGPCATSLGCNGGADVVISSNYWPNINASSGQVEAIVCPFDFCAHDEEGVEANLFNSSTWCNPSSMRDPSSPLCGDCLPGYSEWSHKCVPCAGAHGGAVMVQLLQLLGIVLLQRILSQRGTGTTGFVMLVFVYQFAELALYPKPLLETLLNIFNLQLPSASLGCPFPTDGYVLLAVQLCLPIVCIAFLGLLYVIHNAIARLLLHTNCLGRGPLFLKIGLFVVITGEKSAYIRALIVLCLNLYEKVLEVAFNFLVCVKGKYNGIDVVYQYPGVSCTSDQYAVTRIVLIFIIVLFLLAPIAIFVWLSRQRKQHGSLHHLEERYGRLFHEYRSEYYWWECLLLWRRALLLVVFVPVAGVSLPAAKAALLMCVIVFLTVHIFLSPYQHTLDNTLETLSLATLAALIGLFTNDTLGERVQSIMGGVLLVGSGVILLAPTVHTAVLRVVKEIRARAARSWKQHHSQQSSDDSQGTALTLTKPLV